MNYKNVIYITENKDVSSLDLTDELHGGEVSL